MRFDFRCLSQFLGLAYLSVAAPLLFFGSAASASKPLSFSIHQEYLSTRAMGMGNAFTAIADDHSVLFYNPAALARRDRGNMHFFIRGGVDSGLLDFISEVGEASDGGGTESEKINRITELIESKYGSHFGNRLATLGGFWVRPNWGMAFIPMDLSLDLGIDQQVGPMINAIAYADSTFAYGYGQNVDWLGANHPLSVGVTAKAVHRVYIGEAVSVANLAGGGDVFDDDLAKEGMTFDADIGLMYSPPIPESGMFSFLKHMKPTFAVVIRNALDYGFPINLGLLDGSGEPPPLQRRLDLGSAYQLPQVWVFDPHLALDLRDIGHENWSFGKGLHVGAEFYWTMFNWWKGHWSAGFNQGYWSAGVGARMAVFQFDLATWGEEVGTSSVPRESRRFMLELSLDF